MPGKTTMQPTHWLVLAAGIVVLVTAELRLQLSHSLPPATPAGIQILDVSSGRLNLVDRAGRLHSWSLPDGEDYRVIAGTEQPRLTPGTGRVLVSQTSATQVIELAGGRVLAEIPHRYGLQLHAVDAERPWLLATTADSQISLLDWGAGDTVEDLSLPYAKPRPRLRVYPGPGQALIYDRTTRRLFRYAFGHGWLQELGAPALVGQPAWSTDGLLVAAQTSEGVWTHRRDETIEIHRVGETLRLIAVDGETVVLADDHEALLIDTRSGVRSRMDFAQLQQSPPPRRNLGESRLRCDPFSSAGLLVLNCGSHDRFRTTVTRLEDGATRFIKPRRRHDLTAVSAAAASPDGTVFIGYGNQVDIVAHDRSQRRALRNPALKTTEKHGVAGWAYRIGVVLFALLMVISISDRKPDDEVEEMTLLARFGAPRAFLLLALPLALAGISLAWAWLAGNPTPPGILAPAVLAGLLAILLLGGLAKLVTAVDTVVAAVTRRATVDGVVTGDVIVTSTLTAVAVLLLLPLVG